MFVLVFQFDRFSFLIFGFWSFFIRFFVHRIRKRAKKNDVLTDFQSVVFHRMAVAHRCRWVDKCDSFIIFTLVLTMKFGFLSPSFRLRSVQFGVTTEKKEDTNEIAGVAFHSQHIIEIFVLVFCQPSRTTFAIDRFALNESSSCLIGYFRMFNFLTMFESIDFNQSTNKFEIVEDKFRTMCIAKRRKERQMHPLVETRQWFYHRNTRSYSPVKLVLQLKYRYRKNKKSRRKRNCWKLIWPALKPSKYCQNICTKMLRRLWR